MFMKAIFYPLWVSGPDLGGAQGAPGPRPLTNRGSPTKPLNF